VTILNQHTAEQTISFIFVRCQHLKMDSFPYKRLLIFPYSKYFEISFHILIKLSIRLILGHFNQIILKNIQP